jgi:hypothetical protein
MIPNGDREPNHQTSICRLRVTYDSITEINECKPIEYCARSNRVEAGIFAQSPPHAAQNDRVSHARCGTPPHDAKRKSRARNNFHGHRAQTPRAKLKNPRAPDDCAPRARSHQRKTRASASTTYCPKSRWGIMDSTPLPQNGSRARRRPSAAAAIRRSRPPAEPSILGPPVKVQVPPATQESASSG